MNQSIDTIETAKINFKNGLELIKKMEHKIEMWKPIDGHHYSVSSFGRVRNDKFDKILKNSIKSNGYMVVDLYKNGKRKTVTVHRIVAKAFHKNPENKSCVDHVNGNKKNNHISNLR